MKCCHEPCPIFLTALLLSMLQEAPKRWRWLCAEKYGPLTELHYEAAEEAGSWKRLVASKDLTDKNADQMQKLCPYELQAAVRRIAACCSSRSSICFCVDGSGSVTSEDIQIMTGFVSTTMEAVMQRGVDCKVGLSLVPSSPADSSVKNRKLPMRGVTASRAALLRLDKQLERYGMTYTLRPSPSMSSRLSLLWLEWKQASLR